MKFLKLIVLVVGCLLGIGIFSSTVSAENEDNSFSYEDFKELKEKGVYGSNIEYEDIVELEKENQKHYEECSKLVWQGFYFTQIGAGMPSSGLILPYSVADLVNGSKTVVYNTM